MREEGCQGVEWGIGGWGRKVSHECWILSACQSNEIGKGKERGAGRDSKYLGQIPKKPRQVIKSGLRIIPTSSTFIKQFKQLRNSQL